MEYRAGKAEEFIFNKGDKGDFFYIMIYGKLNIFLPNPGISKIQRTIELIKEVLFKKPGVILSNNEFALKDPSFLNEKLLTLKKELD